MAHFLELGVTLEDFFGFLIDLLKDTVVFLLYLPDFIPTLAQLFLFLAESALVLPILVFKRIEIVKGIIGPLLVLANLVSQSSICLPEARYLLFKLIHVLHK